MAVFTAVSEIQLVEWLAAHYALGRLVAFQGIASGIENSNFFVTTETDDGRRHPLVLTLFERLSFEQLPFYLHLTEHLAARGILVPAPVPGRDGAILRELAGKPATLVTRLPGRAQLQPGGEHCAQVGAMLAKMHLAGADYPFQQPNLRGLAWWNETVPVVRPHVAAAVGATAVQMLDDELAFQQAFHAGAGYAQLPGGPCHCDLFRDNVLFDDTHGAPRLGGFFDFYFAGCDKWLFDVAVTVNDWCLDPQTATLDPARTQALLAGYAAQRSFTDGEQAAWGAMLRAGALRFWISRLWDFYLPRDAQMLQPHDPTHFERVLAHHRSAPTPRLPR